MIDDARAREYVEYELLAYLARRPNACDTHDGIVHWWISLQRLETGAATIDAAIKNLVDQGRLAREQRAGGMMIYFTPDSRPDPSRREE